MPKHIHVHVYHDSDRWERLEGKIDRIGTGVRKTMADVTGLQNAIAQLAQTASNETTEVRDLLNGLKSQVADLTAQVEALTAGQITQETIDQLQAKAAEVDQSISRISNAADPETPTDPNA